MDIETVSDQQLRALIDQKERVIGTREGIIRGMETKLEAEKDHMCRDKELVRRMYSELAKREEYTPRTFGGECMDCDGYAVFQQSIPPEYVDENPDHQWYRCEMGHWDLLSKSTGRHLSFSF